MPELQEVSIKDAKNNLTSLITTASETGMPFIITKRGKPAVKVTPIVDREKDRAKKVEDLDAFFREVESYELYGDIPLSPQEDKAFLGKIREERFV